MSPRTNSFCGSPKTGRVRPGEVALKVFLSRAVAQKGHNDFGGPSFQNENSVDVDGFCIEKSNKPNLEILTFHEDEFFEKDRRVSSKRMAHATSKQFQYSRIDPSQL
jgi:hypothetical protein